MRYKYLFCVLVRVCVILPLTHYVPNCLTIIFPIYVYLEIVMMTYDDPPNWYLIQFYLSELMHIEVTLSMIKRITDAPRVRHLCVVVLSIGFLNDDAMFPPQ